MRKYLLKKAVGLRPDFKPFPHQVEAMKRLDKNQGKQLFAHATGTGKTATAIMAIDNLRKKYGANRALVVAPASLRQNFSDAVKDFSTYSSTVYGAKGEKGAVYDKPSKTPVNIISYELFRMNPEKYIQLIKPDILIMDEIHKARALEGRTFEALQKVRKQVKYVVGLTGSVVNNHPQEIVPLMGIIEGEGNNPVVGPKFFTNNFIHTKAVSKGFFTPTTYKYDELKNKNQLGKILKDKIHFVSHEDIEKDLPRREVETVKVPMSKQQKKVWTYALNETLDPITRWKIRYNLPMNYKQAEQIFHRLIQARQVSTDPRIMMKGIEDPRTESPKIRRVIQDLQEHLGEDPRNKTVVYGNLVHGQIDAVKDALGKEGIPYTQFTGKGQPGVTEKSRQQAVRDFKSGKQRVMVMSSAGGEGLDLKGATMMQMLEGHYNPEKIQQAEARIRRSGALIDRPPEDRKVIIKRYQSVVPPNIIGKILKSKTTSTDEWIYNIADKKNKLNEEFRGILEKKSFLLKKMAETQIPQLSTSDLKDVANKMHNYTEKSLQVAQYGGFISDAIISQLANWLYGKTKDKIDHEAKMAVFQKLSDMGYSHLAENKHYDKILAMTKIPGQQVKIEIAGGIIWLIATVASIIITGKYLAEGFSLNPWKLFGSLAMVSIIKNLITFIPGLIFRKFAMKSAMKNATLDEAVKKYVAKLEKKEEGKFQRAKSYVREMETRKKMELSVL